jgi:hypothetical protein
LAVSVTAPASVAAEPPAPEGAGIDTIWCSEVAISRKSLSPQTNSKWGAPLNAPGGK